MEQYPILEAFYSIQGEGYHTGKPAYFIRLAGCNVGCSWCDVKESWDEANGKRYTVSKIVELVKATSALRVIITGGEPTLFNLLPLTAALNKEGIKTHLETAGTNLITGKWDWICVSPKKFKAPLEESVRQADELKIIVATKNDFTWGKAFLKLVKKECKPFLQPEWSKFAKMQESMVEYVKKYPQWRISLQTHKYLNVP